jgi:3-phosphoshikimate 1-carboxyvinyltransferase
VVLLSCAEVLVDDVVVEPCSGLKGELRVPGDKSISHRAAFLGALSDEGIRVDNFSSGEDCASTLRCLEALGFSVVRSGGRVSVSRGSGPSDPAEPLYAGNSGTTARLLCGLMSAVPGLFGVITGDGSLRGRPMGRVVEPLRSLGARIDGRDGGRLLPLSIRGARLSGGRLELRVPSAQVKTALILAGLMGGDVLTVAEPHLSRDHTEVMLEHLGVPVRRNGLSVTVYPVDRVPGGAWEVPGDMSSAAFWLVAGAVVPRSDLVVRGVCLNRGRTGLLDALRAMGCHVEVHPRSPQGGEAVGDVRVRHSNLRGIKVQPHQVPSMVDELPVLAVAASLAQGQTEIRGAGELRHKECDRIGAMAQGLSAMGVRIREVEDGWVIQGNGGAPLSPARVDSYGDHRIAMALAVGALAASGPVEIRGASCVSISYPEFFDHLKGLVS